jgi:hypothetical protein
LVVEAARGAIDDARLAPFVRGERPNRSLRGSSIETDTAYEQGRWRHATTYLRLRPDLAPDDLAIETA